MMLADYVNNQPPSASLGDLSSMFEPVQLVSPIDEYQLRITEILRFGTLERLSEQKILGRLLALNVVSAAEAYFRSALSAAIEMCPVAQAVAAEKLINLGGVLWHGRKGFSRSAFDHLSFASVEDLRKASLSYLGLALPTSIFHAPLNEYDKVCHLRHGIVHNDGVLPGRNAVKLDIGRMGGVARMKVDYRSLQDIAAVTTTLVSTYNRGLFEFLCKRWAVDWRNRADWDISKEISLFNGIWDLCASKREIAVRADRARLRRVDCLNAVRRHYDLV